MTPTAETIDASPYTADRDAQGNIMLWDDEETIVTLPSDFPVALVWHVAQAYAAGNAAGAAEGRRSGAAAKQAEIRRALGL